jgi:hypothetical protein
VSVVRYADEEPNGLASMIGRLIEQNLERAPERTRHLRAAVVSIRARDIGLSLTLRIGPGRVQVANGRSKEASVAIRADSATLLRFADCPLRLGFPDVATKSGRELAWMTLSHKAEVKGLLRHPRTVSRLNRLLSAR